MGQVTSNLSIYIPADGETLYGTSFAQGMLNVDLHDHSGAPTKGVPLSSSGFADGSVTAKKLNNVPPTSVADPIGGLGFNPITNALTTEGSLLALYGVGTIGFLAQTSVGPNAAAARTLLGTSGQINVSNGNGASDPVFSIDSTYTDKIPSKTAVQVLTSSGTYTPDPKMIYCMVQVVGGGGGGGGAEASGAGSGVGAGGGGSGGYAYGVFTAAQVLAAGYAVVVGAAGAAGAATNTGTGGSGGATTFGTAPLLQATGGSGGTTSVVGAATSNAGGAAGVGSLGTLNVQGNAGGSGFSIVSTLADFAMGGPGAASYVGGQPVQVGQNGTGAAAGNVGTAYGAGGGGAFSCDTGGAFVGGAGVAGVIIITEFIHS